MMVPNKIAHTLIGVVLFGMGVMLMYTMDLSSGTFADFSNTNLNVSNAAPVVETHNMNIGGSISDGATVNPPVSTQSVTITGVIRDDNGDIPTATAVMYREGVTSSCTPAAENCQTTTCAIQSNPDPVREDYTCTFIPGLRYYSQNTVEEEYPGGPNYATQVWRIEVTADDGTTTGSDNSSYFELNSRLALTTGGNVSLGQIDIGAESALGTTTIQNNGNLRIDTQVSSASPFFNCPNGGSLPRGDLRFGTGTGYSGMSSLSNAPTLVDLNLSPDTEGSSGSASLNWKLYTTAPIPAGNCTIDATLNVSKG